MTAPKVGDRVRVVLEGEVTRTWEVGDRVRVVLEGEVTRTWEVGGDFNIGGEAGNCILPDAPHVVSIEVLPPPEPEWKPGDVVRDAEGNVYLRNAKTWSGTDGFAYMDGFDAGRPVRPLTRLVPEGQS